MNIKQTPYHQLKHFIANHMTILVEEIKLIISYGCRFIHDRQFLLGIYNTIKK